MHEKVGREKVGRETPKMEKESLLGQRDPNSTGVLDTRIKNKRHCYAHVLGFLQGRWAGKGGQGNTQNGEGVSFRAT